jgi:CheY-like chemotaxis protein
MNLGKCARKRPQSPLPTAQILGHNRVNRLSNRCVGGFRARSSVRRTPSCLQSRSSGAIQPDRLIIPLSLRNSLADFREFIICCSYPRLAVLLQYSHSMCQSRAAKKIRIIVADDNPLFLDTLVSLLAIEFDIVATATDGGSSLDLVRANAPDLVVLDLAMPGLNGIQVTKELAKSPFSPSVVICSVETDTEIVKAAIEAGAVAYVHKSRIEIDLISAIKTAVQGRSFVSLKPE